MVKIFGLPAGGDRWSGCEDVSERLDVIPAQFRVHVVRRPKYGCRACEGMIAQAPAPTRLIEGGIPTETTVAHVLVSKYADHCVPRTHLLRRRCGAVCEMRVLAPRARRSGAGLKPLRAAVVKSDRGERRRNGGT